jgi:DNA end-binding protein Ku
VAPRAYWKGYLKLSLVSCPVALFPASSEREKISFNQINKKTGNRIRYRKVDAETEEEVDSSDIIKGYEVGKGQYIEIEPEELEAIAIESKRTIEIDEFVPKKEIDELYLNSPLTFPKIRSGRIRAVRENQTIIQCDGCDHLPAWNIYRRSAQVAAPA